MNNFDAFVKALDLVEEFFGDEEWKVGQWLLYPNPAFGNLTPLKMFQIDRANTLLKSVEAMISENYRPE